MRSSGASPDPSYPAVAAYIIGTVCLGLGVLLALFWGAALLLEEPPSGFGVGALTGIGAGGLLRAVGQGHTEPRRSETFFTVATLWLIAPALGAVPYWLSGGLTYLDALFESVSGFTTTGATVLTDFDRFGPVLFLWRAATQWMGGLGIVILFVAVLPQLAVAGRQLFFAESTGVHKEKLTPRLQDTARSVFRVYLLLTTACVVAYWLAGLSPYDAVAHALTTLPAGGFSPRAEGMAAYPAAVQWVAVVFMFLAGLSLVLQYRLIFVREPRPLFADPEVRAYAAIVLVAGAGLALHLAAGGAHRGADAVRHAFFQVVSILTTTGYHSVDFTRWPPPAQAVLVGLMFIGGSAGSAAGGIKVVRWLVIAALVRRELHRTLHPQAVMPLRLGARAVGDEVLRGVAAFVTLYVVLFAAGALLLGVLEGDFVVAFTAPAATIGNIGPGLGGVGPAASYAQLQPASKAFLIFGMWAGRIEVIPVFLLFSPELWRRLRP
ncbi:MAG: TrkH family potassium uptake protein [Armatimonadota bacterium]|nr:TrkH family potassium uptake protein [Armatimonadota bacterium]